MIDYYKFISIFTFIVWAGAAPAQEAIEQFGPIEATRSITLRTTTDVAIFSPTVKAFLETRPDLSIRYEQWGSNALYEKTLHECLQGKPQSDIVISSGAHQMVKLVNDNCAASWDSATTRTLPPLRRWRNQIWGISREPAVMVYNRELVPPAEIPQTRFDLLDLLRPEGSPYAGRVATYDIQASGLGFLFAYMDSLEASTFGGLMEAFARSDAIATCCSADIIEGVANGQYLIAYNILGSYAAEAAAKDLRLGIIAPADYTLILSRAAILPGKTAHTDAGMFLDFLLSNAGQQTMARSHLVFSLEEPFEPGSTNEEIVQPRLIPLDPTLLVAMDKMKVHHFLNRWNDMLNHKE